MMLSLPISVRIWLAASKRRTARLLLDVYKFPSGGIDFRLSSVLAEIDHWLDKGRSCFAALLNKLKLKSPQESVLDQVFPTPSG
jgi:hypothetical protein